LVTWDNLVILNPQRIMKTISIIFLLVLSEVVPAQNISYPTLNKTYKTIHECIPQGWSLFDSLSGDFNGDQIKDLVGIIEYKDTISEARPNGSSIVTSPRVLLIFFKNSNGSLDLKLQHNTFLLRNGEDMRYEVFPQLIIEKGVLSIHYDLFHDYLTYKFRFQNSYFYLIGATVRGIHGGRCSEEDINFNTKKFYKTSYFIGEEKNKEIKHLYLKDLKPIRMEDFKMPLTYKLPGDYTL
jgi:hypothetical protein